MSATNTGRPLPLHGQLEEVAIDYRLCRNRALADDILTESEARELISFADRLEAHARQVAARDAATVALLAGRDGLHSDRFRERVTAAWKANVIEMFPTDPEPEPNDARAA